MAITNSNQNPGVRPQGQLLIDMILGSPTLDKGLMRVVMNEAQNVDLERFRADNDKLIAPLDNPNAAAEADMFHKSYVTITPGECMLWDKMNPKSTFSETDWAKNWANGSWKWQQVAPHIKNAIMTTGARSIANNLETLIWQGDTTSGVAATDRFDGLEKIIEADGAVNNVTPAGAITKSNIIDILEALIDVTPDAVLEGSNPTIVMSHKDKQIYFSALRDTTITKGSEPWADGIPTFAGYKIISTGISKDKIVFTNVGTGNDSNLVGATWMSSDYTTPTIDKLDNYSEFWYFLAKFRFGVNIVWGKEISYYKPV